MAEHYFSYIPKSRSEPGLIRCILRGLEFDFATDAGVFSSKRIDNGTRLLIEEMELPEKGTLLDLGCGYGVIGIVAAKIRPNLKVVMTDVNSRAIKLATQNIALNHVGNANVLLGNLYKPLENQIFTTIISNPPVSAGMKITVEPLIKNSIYHLEKGGSLQLVIRSNKGGNTLRTYMKSNFGNVITVSRRAGYKVFKSVREK